MARYRISDEQVYEFIDADDMAEAVETAEEIWREGSWDSKFVADLRVAELDDNDEETGEVEWIEVECGSDPPEPECTDESGHDWQSPYPVVGGIDSNPGVWSTGGTTIVTKECCSHCGVYRIQTAYGSQRNPGQCDAVEYEDADEDSLAWIESL